MAFTYLGGQELTYPAYKDAATDRLLVAEPGGSYDMFPVDAGLPVPPSDGRWAEDVPPPALPAPDPLPALAPAPEPAPEGGV